MYSSTASGTWYLIGSPEATRQRRFVLEIASSGAVRIVIRWLATGIAAYSAAMSGSRTPGLCIATSRQSARSRRGSCQVRMSAIASCPTMK